MTRLDEEKIAALLARTGPRPLPYEAMKQAIKANVKNAWLSEVKRRQDHVTNEPREIRPKKRNFFVTISAIAAVLVISLVGLFDSQTQPMTSYGQVSQTVNNLQYQFVDPTLKQASPWQPLTKLDLSQAIRIKSGLNSYAAIEFSSGINLRIGENSTVEIASVDSLMLKHGQVYIDSDDSNAAISINTPFGIAKDIGTQFMVRVNRNDWRVQVREGLVEVAAKQQTQTPQAAKISIKAGEKVDLSTQASELKRIEISPHDESWQWIQGVSTEYKIEGSSLHDYLNWFSRETGKKIIYQSEIAENAAKRTILHGSVVGMMPSETLTLVLPTTKFTWHETENGHLAVRN